MYAHNGFLISSVSGVGVRVQYRGRRAVQRRGWLAGANAAVARPGTTCMPKNPARPNWEAS